MSDRGAVTHEIRCDWHGFYRTVALSKAPKGGEVISVPAVRPLAGAVGPGDLLTGNDDMLTLLSLRFRKSPRSHVWICAGCFLCSPEEFVRPIVDRLTNVAVGYLASLSTALVRSFAGQKIRRTIR